MGHCCTSISSACAVILHVRRSCQRCWVLLLPPLVGWRLPSMAWAREVFHRWHAMLGRLGKKLHELEHLLWHRTRDRQSKLLSFLDVDRVIMGPGPCGEHVSEAGCLLGGIALLQKF